MRSTAHWRNRFGILGTYSSSRETIAGLVSTHCFLRLDRFRTSSDENPDVHQAALHELAMGVERGLRSLDFLRKYIGRA